jgi:hypothetical protein
MPCSSEDVPAISHIWAPRIAAALCAIPAAAASYAAAETARYDWLLLAGALGALSVGVARRGPISLRAMATLLMSLGVSMPIGAASPLWAMDVRAEPWLTSSVAAGICAWLALCVLAIMLGWELERIRRGASRPTALC